MKFKAIMSILSLICSAMNNNMHLFRVVPVVNQFSHSKFTRLLKNDFQVIQGLCTFSFILSYLLYFSSTSY